MQLLLLCWCCYAAAAYIFMYIHIYHTTWLVYKYSAICANNMQEMAPWVTNLRFILGCILFQLTGNSRLKYGIFRHCGYELFCTTKIAYSLDDISRYALSFIIASRHTTQCTTVVLICSSEQILKTPLSPCSIWLQPCCVTLLRTSQGHTPDLHFPETISWLYLHCVPVLLCQPNNTAQSHTAHQHIPVQHFVLHTIALSPDRLHILLLVHITDIHCIEQ